MKTKHLFWFTIVLNALHGIGLMLGAKDAAQMGLPELSADVLNMGAGAYEIAAFFNFFVVAVLLSVRNFGTAEMRAISKGIAGGFVILTAGVVYHMFTLIPGQAPPAAAVGVFGAITAWALFVAFGTKDAEA